MVAAAHALPYPVTIAPGALERLRDVLADVGAGRRACAITDERVGALYGHRVSAQLSGMPSPQLLRFPLTEATKTRATWQELTDVLLAGRFGRDSILVAVGGGVVGDVVGFVAATYMRGIPYVHVPTTLLAMVDASIGGKTGVDTPHGKNLVGAFHNPAAVIVDPTVLETLPLEHTRGGMAEIIKHGVVADADYFARVRSFLQEGRISSRDWRDWTDLITRSIEIKTEVVTRDEREAGLRKVLNFGHTIGHAIEAATDFAMHHGEAVAIGMVVEARIAALVGEADPTLADAVEGACRAAGLPVRLGDLDVDRLVEFTRSDKKAIGARVEYALPRRIGEMTGADRGYGTPVDDRIVREALRS